MPNLSSTPANPISTPNINSPNTNNDQAIKSVVDSISVFSNFQAQYTSNSCFRVKVNTAYQSYIKSKDSSDPTNEISSINTNLSPTNTSSQLNLSNFDVNNVYVTASFYVYKNNLAEAQSFLSSCLSQAKIQTSNALAKTNSTNGTVVSQGLNYQSQPFDRRLDKLFIDNKNNASIRTPMSTLFMEAGTSGFVISDKAIQESVKDATKQSQFLDRAKRERSQMLNDSFYQGVPAIQNNYAIVKLYGAEGGQKIVNKKDERRWYEIDSAIGQNGTLLNNYSSTPTTSSLISWGNGDPYGRTPYSFSDFAFCKYWKKIENNRLITLRRFAAPIYDNMKFPGMDGNTNEGTAAKNNSNDSKNVGSSESAQGSSGRISFPPMTTAVTYFGEETGNTLNNLLKFSSGVLWEDVQANVWEVNSESTPDSKAGPGQLYGTLTSFATMLNVGVGNFDPKAVMNQGNLPPDPYKNGPYENRIIGPVNRIDSVKKRKPGMDFKMDGLNIVFEYVGRPIGGINPKAALLDIISNFLVLGSASAVFFGGQHRFLANPAKYPFLGGSKGIQQWYSGNPIGWAKTTTDQFSGNASSVGSGLFSDAKQFFSTLFGKGDGGGIFGAIEGLFTGKGPAGNITKNYLASKTAGQVPFLTGMKAILTGEPVGDWHLTIGNPLNPIAMIGNLICEGIDFETNDELGPDDFPTEIKLTVKLKHGMPRDKDAIQSIFNRGMGRIYDLPDSFVGTSDGQTHIDNATKNNVLTGTSATVFGIISNAASYGTLGPSGTSDNALHSNISVWNRSSFLGGVSPNADQNDFQNDQIFRSAYRQSDWIVLRSLQ
jgi:hypothetical protein